MRWRRATCSHAGPPRTRSRSSVSRSRPTWSRSRSRRRPRPPAERSSPPWRSDELAVRQAHHLPDGLAEIDVPDLGLAFLQQRPHPADEVAVALIVLDDVLADLAISARSIGDLA